MEWVYIIVMSLQWVAIFALINWTKKLVKEIGHGLDEHLKTAELLNETANKSMKGSEREQALFDMIINSLKVTNTRGFLKSRLEGFKKLLKE